MGAFEDFVNSNLGIRQPFISDFAPPTGDNKSLKAAGIRGSKFLDLNTNFLYEKTGENNNTDWIKIAELGEPRGGSPANLAGDQYIQFVSGSALVGSEDFIYQYDIGRVSGVSGYYQDIDGISGHLTEELIVGESDKDVFVSIADGEFDVYGNINIDGNINVSGNLNPVQDSQFNIGSSSKKINNLYLNTLHIGQSINYSLLPRYVFDISLGVTPSINGSSEFSISRISGGLYQINFPSSYQNINSYRISASISNISSSGWGIASNIQKNDRPNVEVLRGTNNFKIKTSLSGDITIDSGIVTILIYES